MVASARKLLVLLSAAVWLLPGCTEPAAPVQQAELPDDRREIGMPWPVLAGEFAGPLYTIDHDGTSYVFAAGYRGPVRYRLDYGSRQILREDLRARPERPETSYGRAELTGEGDWRELFLRLPEGGRTLVSEDALFFGPPGFAQTQDGSGLAFYEKKAGGGRLVYHDLPSGDIRTWRSFGRLPARAALIWSPGQRYLLEEVDGRLNAYERGLGLPVGSVEGGGPLFAPDDRYLAFRRPDGRPGLLDLRTGFARSLPPANKGYRFLPVPAWSPDGSHLCLQAEAAEADRAPAFILHVYDVATGAFRQYPLEARLDLPRYAALFHAAQEGGDLQKLLAELDKGPFAVLGQTGCLVGRDNQVALLDSAVNLRVLQVFPDRVEQLSLAEAERRLIVVTARGGRRRLYAWRLPESILLAGAFLDHRDLALGRLRLGATASAIRRALGPPLSREDRLDPVGGRDVLEISRYPEASLAFAGGRLVRIIYSARGPSTGRGIAVGAPQAEIFDRYGRPHYRRDDYLSYYGEVDGERVKVAFKLGGDRKVAAILIALAAGEARATPPEP